MSKVIESPVKRFPGTVTLKDPLPFPLVVKWEEALANVEQFDKNEKDAKKLQKFHKEIEQYLFPILPEMVEAWNLANVQQPVTAENFPNAAKGTSARSTHELVDWLIAECHAVYNGNEDADPNA